MSGLAPDRERLGTLVAVPLRWGTLAAVAMLAAGIGLGYVEGRGDEPPLEQPLFEAIAAGGASAVISVGLLLLTLVPLAMAVGASIGLGGRGERRYRIASLVVVALLLASLVVPAILLKGGV